MIVTRENIYPYYGIYFVDEYGDLIRGISDSDVVLDAGANIGLFTMIAALKARKVIAVEPLPSNFEILSVNIGLNGLSNVILVNKALGDYNGVGYLSGQGAMATLDQKGTEVSVIRIDDMLREIGVDRVDVVKMDIEGSEVKALRGQKFLEKVKRIMLETHGETNTQEVCYILEKEGFQIQPYKFSYLKIAKNIVLNFGDFIQAEWKTGLAASRLVFNYMIKRSGHPVPAADPTSDRKLLYAYKKRIE